MELAPLAEEMRSRLPEMPQQKRERFVEEYGLAFAVAKSLTENPAVADFTERVMSELAEWSSGVGAGQDQTASLPHPTLTRLVASWVLNKLPALLPGGLDDLSASKLTPENFAELLSLIAKGTLTQTVALTVLAEILTTGADPSQVIEERGWKKMDDEASLSGLVENLIAKYPLEWARYRGGETKLLKFFIGEAMRETKGNADPAVTKKILDLALAKRPE
jgi:aspartyl-tRNA(Asn)/glutamyl-tRNA(Gln) amidotransferase subunit B